MNTFVSGPKKDWSLDKLRVISREQFVSIGDLFGFRKSQKNFRTLSSLIELALKSKYGDLRGVPSLNNPGAFGVQGLATLEGIIVEKNPIIRDSDPTLFNERRRVRAITAHEVVHRLHDTGEGSVGVNEFITANAIGQYFNQLQLARQGNIKQIQISGATQRAINAACGPGEYLKTVKEHGRRKAEYVTRGKEKSFADLGKALGTLSIQIETELQKPGLGPIIIREVSLGKLVQEVISQAQNGKFERERIVWTRRHPRVRNFILREAYPELYLTQVSRERKRTLHSKNPTRPRTKRWPTKLVRVK